MRAEPFLICRFRPFVNSVLCIERGFGSRRVEQSFLRESWRRSEPTGYAIAFVRKARSSGQRRMGVALARGGSLEEARHRANQVVADLEVSL